MLLLLNLLVSALLTGLIWTIQLVHYPSFALVGTKEWQQFQQQHTRRISWLVMPLMLAELGLSLWLLYHVYKQAPALLLSLHLLAVACVGAIWLLTALVFVPLHKKLEIQGYIPGLTRALLRWNWPRTLLWTLRTLILFYLLSQAYA